MGRRGGDQASARPSQGMPRLTLDLSPLPAAPAPVLDAEQAAVVAHSAGPLLVLAGPGTGKTTTITEAVAARLSGPDPIPANRILVLTFGRRAAGEIRDRIVARLGGGVVPTVATFHSFAYGIVRSTADDYLITPKLLSGAEEDVRVRDLLVGAVEDGSIPWPEDLEAALPTLGFANEVRAVMVRAAAQQITPGQLSDIGRRAGIDAWSAVGLLAQQEADVAELEQVMSYHELLELAIERVASHSLAGTYRAIFVDEYQDTDPQQVRLLRALIGADTSLVAVGDPDQAIYGFRGADLSGILEFPQAFRCSDGSPAPVIALRTARRFAEPISRVARIVLGDRLHPHLPVEQQRAHRSPALREDPHARPVRVEIFDSEHSRAVRIAREIREMRISAGLDWSDMAVLVRTGSQIPSITRALIADGIPVAVAADEIPLRSEPAAKALLQALRLCAHPSRVRGNEAADLLGGPLAGLDAADLRRLGRALRARHRVEHPGEAVPSSSDLLADAVRAGMRGEFIAAGVDERVDRDLANALALFALAHERIRAGARPEEALWVLWNGRLPRGGRAHGWPDRLRAAALRGSRAADHDLDAVMALFDTAERTSERYGGVVGIDVFLEALAEQTIPAEPVAERAARSDAVRVLTAHRAKGLEWDSVWIVGAEEGVWPDLRPRGSLLHAEQLTVDGLAAPIRPIDLLAEERRLLFVACTRAKRSLIITALEGVAGEGEQPSRFVDELIRAEVVQVERISTRPRFRLSLDGLVAELRHALLDPATPAAVRDAAAVRLRALADDPRIVGADPRHWWGIDELTQGVEPVRPADQPISISGSALDSVLECPRKWFLEREAQAETPREPSTRFGTVVHALAEYVAKDEIPADVDAADAYLDRIWHELRFDAPWQSDADRVQARAAVARFLDYHLRAERELVEVEVDGRATLEVPTPDGGTIEMTVNGRLDRIERDDQGRYYAIDLKNMKNPPSGTEIPEHPQLGLYQAMLREGGVASVPAGEQGGAALVQLRAEASKKTPGVAKVQLQAALPDERPAWIDYLLGDGASTIRAEDFQARICKRCDTCAYRRSCPAQAEGIWPEVTS